MAYAFEPKRKAKTSETFPSDYTVLDLETTGLSSATDCIIEFGAIRVRNHQPVASFSELCRPKVFHYLPFGSESEDFLLQDGKKICYVSEVITGITHITNRMLVDQRGEEEVLKDFFSFLGNDHVFGHNVSFDLGFLASRGNEFFQQSPCFSSSDTMKISRRLLPFLSRHRLMDLALYYDIDYAKAHRAVEDCEITRLVLNDMEIDAEDIFGSLDDFCQHYHPQPLSRKVSFLYQRDENSEQPYEGQSVVFTRFRNKALKEELMKKALDEGASLQPYVSDVTSVVIYGDQREKTGNYREAKRKSDVKLIHYDEATK